MTPTKPIRFGMIGASRGMTFAPVLDVLDGQATLTALCDVDESALAAARQRRADLRVYTESAKMLADDACDAVLVASPMQLHARHVVEALSADKHVLCEVPACLTDAEARQILAAAKRSRGRFMMSENYCYMRPHLMLRRMVERGVFGEITYAEGMYLHDVRTLYFKPDGSLTWRGEVHGTHGLGNTYPTHSLGPIAQWLGIGIDDMFESVYSISTPPACLADYTRRRFGDQHPGATQHAWTRGDSSSNLIRTKKGRVISLRADLASSRPHHMACHELQGTSAVFRTSVDPRQPALIWIDGRSPASPLPVWESYETYAQEFEHPLWQQFGPQAAKAGHGGGDLIVISEFLRALDHQERMPIDVYDALHWSSILWLSADSERTGQVVKAIDYRDA